MQYDDGLKNLSNSNLLLYKILDEKEKNNDNHEEIQTRIRRCAKFLKKFAMRKRAYNSIDHIYEIQLTLKSEKPENWVELYDYYENMIQE